MAAALIKSVCLALTAAAILIAAFAPPAEAAISCATVVKLVVKPCLPPYVTRSGALAGGCCDGVRGLYGAAKTTADRQAVCSCLKDLVNAYARGVSLGKVARLPKTCGIKIPYKISPSTDCSKVR